MKNSILERKGQKLKRSSFLAMLIDVYTHEKKRKEKERDSYKLSNSPCVSLCLPPSPSLPLSPPPSFFLFLIISWQWDDKVSFLLSRPCIQVRYHDITENRQPGKIEKGRVFISLLRKVASNQRIIQKIAFIYLFFFSFLFSFSSLFPLYLYLIFTFYFFFYFFPSSFLFASETY